MSLRSVFRASGCPAAKFGIPHNMQRLRLRLLPWRAAGKPRTIVQSGIVGAMVVLEIGKATAFFADAQFHPTFPPSSEAGIGGE